MALALRIVALLSSLHTSNKTSLATADSLWDLAVATDQRKKFDARISLTVRKTVIRARLIPRCFVSRNIGIYC